MKNEMTPKERIWNCITGKPVDRTAWCPFLAYYWEHQPQSVQQMGQQAYMKLLGADPLLRGFGQLSYMEYNNCEIRETVKGRVKEITYETPVGSLHEHFTYSPDGDTWFLTKHPVTEEEDFKVLQYIYEKMTLREAVSEFEENYRKVGEEGLIMPVIGTQAKTALQSMVEHWCGTVDLTYALADFPEAVEECLAAIRKKDLENVRIAMKSSAESFIFWEDSSTTNISPSMFEQYTMPVFREWGDILHENGRLLVHHACGHLHDLMPLIARSGIDVLESISPSPTGNIELTEARRILPENIAIIGGIEPVKFQDYNMEELEEYITGILHDMKGTRYILANSDSCPPGVEEKKFRLISELVRR